MKYNKALNLLVFSSLLTLSTTASAGWFDSVGSAGWTMLSNGLATLIGWGASLFAIGVGVYAIMTFIMGNFQFLLGFMFSPIGLLLMPLDKGRVLSSSVSMMLTGITIFVVAFTVLTVSIELFSGAAEKLALAAQKNGDGGMYKLTFAMASVIYAYIMYQIVKQANSWGASLFGGVGFDLGGMVRSMGGAGQSLGRGAGSVAGKTIGATGRGVAGAVGGAVAGGKAGGKAGSKDGGLAGAAFGGIKGALSGAGKGAGHAIRGRGGELSKKPPAVGSGMRISDSFKAGGQAATQSSKVSSKGKEILSNVPPSNPGVPKSKPERTTMRSRM
jgi:hypothetical protein